MRILNIVPFTLRGPRVALVAVLLLSLAPPILYYRLFVPVLDSERLPTGMLPSFFTLLRLCGFFSLFVTGFVALGVGLSFWRPAASQALLTRCVIVLLFFDTFYLCYALIVIASMIVLR